MLKLIPVLTRKQAKELGLSKFFNGVPCKHGHIGYRQTSKGECIQCKRIWQNNNPEKRRAWHDNNRERLRKNRRLNRDEINRKKREWYAKKGHISSKAWREKNKEHVRASWNAYAKKNKDRRIQYRKDNIDMYREACRRRQAAQKNATPAWANIKEMIAFYKQARQLTEKTGVNHHVDHIIPLQGKNVCGLHVPYNLQVLTATENVRKSNTWRVE